MANAWDALLNSRPTPVDTNRNADYDNMMGYAESPDDDNATAFAKGLGSSLSRNTPQGQAITGEIIKAKLANQMAIQLMQAKIDLQKANPEYDSHPTPYGSIIMTNKFNPDDTHEVGGVEGARDAYKAKMAAQTMEDNTKALPEYQKAQLDEALAKPGLVQAQTRAADAMPALREAMMRKDDAQATKAATDKGPKPLSESDKLNIRKQVMQEEGFDPSSPMVKMLLATGDQATNQKLQAVNAKATAAIQAEEQKRAAGKGGAGGGALAAPSAAPDVSGLLDLSSGLGGDDSSKGLFD